MSESTEPQSPASSAETLPVTFGFPGQLSAVLHEFLAQDASNWKLSWKFFCYYSIRPWLPLPIRQFLQQRRNSSLSADDEWYIHKPFLNAWRAALSAEIRLSPEQSIIHPWPDGFSHATIMTHDIESSVGASRVTRLAELEEQYNIRSAWYFVPASYRIDHGVLNSLRERGHEVGVHGYNHDGKLFANQQMFERRAQHINAIAKTWQACGFRSPMMHRQLVWMQSLDVAYDTSCFDIDPYQAMPGGVGGVWPFMAGRFVELPCTLPQDHTLFVTLNQMGINSWRKKHELIRRLRGMALYLIHPDYLETPRQWDYYRELLEYLNTIENDWRCLPHEAAQWWKLRQASICREREIRGPAATRGRTLLLDDLFTELQPEAEPKEN